MINLKYIVCYGNQLSSLDVSGLINLQTLQCNNNQLTSLIVSGLTNITALYCYNNQLPILNVSGLTNLQVLNCANNQLISLNASELINLQALSCATNQLTTLFIKNGSIENNLIFSANPNLQYICADDNQVSQVQNLITQYGYNNCTVDSVCVLSNNEFQDETVFEVYPNPTKDSITLKYDIDQNVLSLTIYNTLGQLMFVTSNTSKTLDVSNLTLGTYFIKIITDKGSSNSKFIKE